MTLYMIGIGLNDEKDISIKGLEAVKQCDAVYLESYTSILQVEKGKLEELYGKEVIPADRELVEKKSDEMLDKAKEGNVAFLVIGDVFSATTHTDLKLRALEKGIDIKIIHNTSVINAVGDTGLELYKFGKTTSIPFENKDVKTPYNVLIDNLDKGMHTLFLLDLRPDENKFMTIGEALEYLETLGLTKDAKAVGCTRLGSDDQAIKYGPVEKIKDADFGGPPYCIIIPAKLHFMEEESLKRFAV